jgi:hypothetical protein
MQYHDDGRGGYTVSYDEQDTERFARRWPGSTVRGSGKFELASNGDLVGWDGDSAGEGYGEDWLAFSHDCQMYGMLCMHGMLCREPAAGEGGDK